MALEEKPSFEGDYGIFYPLSSQITEINAVYLQKSLGFRYVRIHWLDLTNVLRLRILPISYFVKCMQSPRPSISMTKATLGQVHLSLAEGFSPMGEYLYIPDITTWRPCPYAPGHVSVMGWFQEKAPINGVISVDLCPRGILARIVDDIQKRAQVQFLVGIETEFVLLKSSEPVGRHDWSAANGLVAGEKHTEVVQEIAEALIASYIPLEMYHPEAGPGQYEIIIGALPPLEAADAAVHVRDVIRNIASTNGLRATFAPRIIDNAPGNSAHAHISIHGPEPRAGSELSVYEKQFLAGILEHLPALPAFTLPIPASYERMADGLWTGGTYVHYGTENRESPVRLCNVNSVNARNFEMRFMDCIANPYLGLAAMLGAGADGIFTQAELTMQDCPGPRSAAQLSEEERQTLGITKRLPLSWEEGRQNLQDNPVVLKLFGMNFIEKYLSVNKLLRDQLDQRHGYESRTQFLELF